MLNAPVTPLALMLTVVVALLVVAAFCVTLSLAVAVTE
jgi:hypothetical protein